MFVESLGAVQTTAQKKATAQAKVAATKTAAAEKAASKAAVTQTAASVKVAATKAAAAEKATAKAQTLQAKAQSQVDALNAQYPAFVPASPMPSNRSANGFIKPYKSFRSYKANDAYADMRWLKFASKPYASWPPNVKDGWLAYVKYANGDWDGTVGPFYGVNSDEKTWPPQASSLWEKQIYIINETNAAKKGPSFGQTLTALGKALVEANAPKTVFNPKEKIKADLKSVSALFTAADTGFRALNPLDSTLAKMNAAGKKAGGIGRLLGGAGNIALKKPVETIMVVYGAVSLINGLTSSAASTAGKTAAEQTATQTTGQVTTQTAAQTAGETAAKSFAPGTDLSATQGASSLTSQAAGAGGGGGGSLAQQIASYGKYLAPATAAVKKIQAAVSGKKAATTKTAGTTTTTKKKAFDWIAFFKQLFKEP